MVQAKILITLALGVGLAASAAQRKPSQDAGPATLNEVALSNEVAANADLSSPVVVSCADEIHGRHSYDDLDDKEDKLIVKTVTFSFAEFSEHGAFEGIEIMGALKEQLLKEPKVRLKIDLLSKNGKSLFKHPKEFEFEQLNGHFITKGLNVTELVKEQTKSPSKLVIKIYVPDAKKTLCEKSVPVLSGD